LIRKMISSGVISEKRIDESYRRIMKMKAQLAGGVTTAAYKQQLEQASVELNRVNTALQDSTKKLSELEAQLKAVPAEPIKTKKKKRKK
jgi:beta-N-acetylhexosaminidase